MAKLWFSDPDLFMEHWGSQINVYRLNHKTTVPLTPHDFIFVTMSTDLTDPTPFVGDLYPWKSSDFEAFIAYLNSHDILVNCQGLVITTTFPRDKASSDKPNMDRLVRFKSHEVLNMASYGLPDVTVPVREVQYLGGEGGSAHVENSTKEEELLARLASCIKERDQEKAEKQILSARIAELKSMVANF